MQGLSDLISNFIPGYKTLLASLGLIGVGLNLISNGDWIGGIQSVSLGLAALGIRFKQS